MHTKATAECEKLTSVTCSSIRRHHVFTLYVCVRVRFCAFRFSSSCMLYIMHMCSARSCMYQTKTQEGAAKNDALDGIRVDSLPAKNMFCFKE